MTAVLFAAGLVALVAGAELLVRGAARLAGSAGISPLVVGLTVVAFGTSAPEMAVSVAASLHGQADLTLGNVVGSNVFNVLFILGVSALLTPLHVSRDLIRRQVPFMVAVSCLFWLIVLDGAVTRLDGVLLLSGVVGYTAVLILRERRASPAEAAALPAAAPTRGLSSFVVPVLLALAGLALLVVGSRWLVDSARSMAGALGVPDLVVGLTVVAAGTSLPELATSVVASVRGERDLAVGNVVGSNIFNILAIVGVAAVVAPAGVAVAPSALTFDVPVMTAVAVACLPAFVGGLIDRWEGGIFVGYYIAYVTYLILDAQDHAALEEYRAAMLGFVLPLTVLTLLIIAWRTLRQPKRGS